MASSSSYTQPPLRASAPERLLERARAAAAFHTRLRAASLSDHRATVYPRTEPPRPAARAVVALSTNHYSRTACRTCGHHPCRQVRACERPSHLACGCPHSGHRKDCGYNRPRRPACDDRFDRRYDRHPAAAEVRAVTLHTRALARALEVRACPGDRPRDVQERYVRKLHREQFADGHAYFVQRRKCP